MSSPPPEPFDGGLLDVGDGQRVSWRVYGNPHGTPAVALHGGPGGESSRGLPRRFDPARYRLVQFDQRGCGRSEPHAGEWGTSLTANTTHHLVADIEALRVHLGIDRWVVWGGSWGAALALAYAESFPERVRAMVLVSTFLCRPSDVRWFGHDVGRMFPAEWAALRAGVPEAERDGDLVAAYDRLLNETTDPDVRRRAAYAWAAWEDALLSTDEGYVVPNPRWADERYTVAFARLVTRYFSRGAWLGEHALLDGAARLAGIPGVILHGRLDLSCPPDAPWRLAAAWPDAELHLVPAGHLGNAELERLMVAALDRFVTLP